MRSRRELVFRLKQEIADLWLWLRRPSIQVEQPVPLARLPDPAKVSQNLRETPFAAELEQLANQIMQHRFPIFGATVEAGEQIDWRRDYVNGISSQVCYFRRVPYLDFSRTGDHKIVWELNRHQHLVVLAQAFRLTGRPEYLGEIWRQFESWWAGNPYMRGINWASALEVAFRALSWIWIYHLAGDRMDDAFRRRFLSHLYRHGLYLAHNLSIYFSPNTHLLGEAVALHALGTLFPVFPRSKQWARRGAEIVARQIEFQVREDGSHFEQSAYYHVYALDLFLFHQILASPGAQYRQKLKRMADYLEALLGGSRVLPSLGDDDGGRLFHPYGRRDRFGRATLATCAALLGESWACDPENLYEQAAWWLPGVLPTRPNRQLAPRSRLFTSSGLATLIAGPIEVLVDAGPFGAASGGHSHSDTLSLIVRLAEEEILIDPGTYTYVTDPKLRDWFRGSAAHNILRIDGKDQAKPRGPFRWEQKPDVEVLRWGSTPQHDFLDALCRYAGFIHRRRVLLGKPDLVFIWDRIDGLPGEHLIEQFWHCGAPVKTLAPGCLQIGNVSRLVLPAAEQYEICVDGEHGWRSRVYGERTPEPVIRVWRKAGLPAWLGTVIDFSGSPEQPSLRLEGREDSGPWVMYRGAARQATIRFGPRGLPEYSPV